MLGHYGTSVKSYKEYMLRECQANVLAAKLSSPEFVIDVLKSWGASPTNGRLEQSYDEAFVRTIQVLEGERHSCR